MARNGWLSGVRASLGERAALPIVDEALWKIEAY